MKKLALIMPFLLLIPAFVYADSKVVATAKSADLQQDQNSIRISTRPEILGLWGMEMPKDKKCVEYYNFRGGNQVVVHSAKEWSTGMFEYQPSPDNTLSTLPTLVMQVNYENNEVDCSGNKVDQSGEISQYFVQWKNNNQINFCASELGKDCFATLRRVLP
jgi:hypothetical protein